MDTISDQFESLTLQHYKPATDILFVIGPTGCGKANFIDDCVLPRIEAAGLTTKRASDFEVSPYLLTSNGCLDLLLAIEMAQKGEGVFLAQDIGTLGFHDRSDSVTAELALQLTDLRPMAYLPLREKVRENMIRMIAAMTRNAARSGVGLVITMQHLCSLNQVLNLVDTDFVDRLKVVNWIPAVERRKQPSPRFKDNLMRTLSLSSSMRARGR